VARRRVARVDIERDLGRKRTIGAGGRKLGPVYPKKPTRDDDGDHSAFSKNVRLFYKTLGFGHKKALGFALDIRNGLYFDPKKSTSKTKKSSARKRKG
jgi:hypothetical protein